MTDKDPATVLEDAADLLLIHGRCRRTAVDGDSMCVIAAITRSAGYKTSHVATEALRNYLRTHNVRSAIDLGVACPVQWNDSTEDDFEVIDTLRHVAKELRNEASV